MSLPTERKVYRRVPDGSAYKLVQQTEQLPSPLPTSSILVKIHTVALNYRDMNMLRGNNPWPILPNGIPASDAVGTVLALGPAASRFKVGERVLPITDVENITGDEQSRCWLASDADGVLASHAVFDEQTCVAAPASLPNDEAAILCCAGVTAFAAIASDHALMAGQTFLLQGTGGVSIMALKLATAAGCRVIVSSSSDEKLASLEKLAGRPVGTVNYATTHDWDVAVRKHNGGRGVDVVLENGGASSLLRSIRACRKSGQVSQVGYLGKQDPQNLDGLVPLLIDTDVSLKGINYGSRRDFEAMNRFIDASGVRFGDVIFKRFGFDMEGVLAAYACLRGGGHIGKVVIDIDID